MKSGVVCFLATAFLFSAAQASVLNCITDDQSREQAGLPQHSLVADLQTQNTDFIRRSLDENGQIVEKKASLVSATKVSQVAPTDRTTCELKTVFNESTRRGGFNFSCKAVLVRFAYDLNSGWANYYESLGSVSKTIRLKNCSVSN